MDPQDGPVQKSPMVNRRRGRIIGLIAILAAAGGLWAGLLAMTLAKPPSPAGDVAGVTFAPSISPVGPQVTLPSPASKQTPRLTPSPVAVTPFSGRLLGTWLATSDTSVRTRATPGSTRAN